MMDKKGIEFTFNWIFSIIVGAVIIILSIYASNSFIKTERTLQDTETIQDLETLLNPMQTSVESASKPSAIAFQREVRITSQCINSAGLGEQQIRLSSKNKIGGSWSSISFPNRIQGYVFVNSQIQGKKISVLIAPFFMPYKVGDIVMLWTDKYCFVNAPSEVEDELQILNGSEIQFTNSKFKCASQSKTVCFLNSPGDIDEGCDTRVNTYIKQVRSTGKLVYYEGPLLYAAIFSSADIYECNLKRIIERAKYLSNIYSEKSALLGSTEKCGGSLFQVMKDYASSLSLNDSKDLSQIMIQSQDIKTQQGDLLCALWN